MSEKLFKKLRNMTIVMTLLLAYSLYFGWCEETNTNKTGANVKEKFTIAIDAGHGGRDPGVVSKKGDLEKDINLSLAIKLKRLMESEGAKVVMVRESDEALYKDGDTNKKVADMRNRVKKVNDSKADLFVSIHVNSYVDEKVYGSQVFYLKGDEESSKLANLIQKNLNKIRSDKEGKEAKANKSYYLLKNINAPAVIAECGFLSNEEELALLKEESYQEKVAWSIHMGVMEYYNDTNILEDCESTK